MDKSKISNHHSHFLVRYDKNSYTYYNIVKSCEVFSPKNFTVKEPVYIKFPDIIALCNIIMTSNDVNELISILAEMEKHYHSVIAKYGNENVEQESIAGPSGERPGSPVQKMITFGRNKTEISERNMNWIRWTNYKFATIDLLDSVFTEETLASHTLTGRVGPKPQLDPKKIEDISWIVTQRFKVFIIDVHKVISKYCNSLHSKYVRRLDKFESSDSDSS